MDPAVLPLPQIRNRHWVPILIGTLIFAAASIWAAVSSEGFLEADGCTHYLYARFALDEPHYLVNIWGRPLKTAIYALPAYFGGLLGVRFTSLALALACAGITYRIAKHQQFRWPALAFVFVLAQPLVFLHSFSELTELPFAMLLAGAFWAYQCRRFWIVALLIGLSPMSRPEGFGFIGLCFVALIAHRQWRSLLILRIPLVAWHFWGWHVYGQQGPVWRGLIDNWPYAANSTYQSGSILHFVALLPAVTSPLIFPATMFGAWLCFRSGIGDWRMEIEDWRLKSALSNLRSSVCNPHSRCDLLIVTIPLLILTGHSLLYYLGKMASNGELRYMLIVAPFWALLAARGWEWAWQRFNWKHPFAWAALVALLPATINFKRELPGGYTFGYQVLPLVLHGDWQTAKTLAAWYRSSDIRSEYPYLCASHPGVFLFLDISPSGPKVKEWHVRTLKDPPASTLLIYDKTYGRFNADSARSATLEDLMSWGWEPINGMDESGKLGWASEGTFWLLGPSPVGGIPHAVE